MMRSVTDSKSTDGGMEYLPLMGRNSHWARQRKFVHAYLTEAANAQYYGVIDFEVKRWLFRLLQEPDKHVDSLEDMAAKVMSTLTWDDPDVSETLAGSAWALLTQMSPAGPITNLITPLWHLPSWMNPWRQAETKRRNAQSDFWMKRYQQVKALYDKGDARPSWTRQYLSIAKKQKPLTGDQEASAALGMLAIVGIFTVAGPLHYFLLAMVCHPDWQKKIQEEIDSVCRGGLPTLNDSPELPILRACIKETMRWRPNVPTGVAHEAEEDDYYHGYFIPKGARILPLDWAFLRNPEKYPDPDNFRPERWLEPHWPTYQQPLTVYPTIKGMSSFGYGRRQCLGQTLTQDETLLACGGLMWAFDLCRKRNPVTGMDIDIPLHKSNSLLIIKPDPFEMAFVPRSEMKRKQIVDNWLYAEATDKDHRAQFLREVEASRRRDRRAAAMQLPVA